MKIKSHSNEHCVNPTETPSCGEECRRDSRSGAAQYECGGQYEYLLASQCSHTECLQGSTGPRVHAAARCQALAGQRSDILNGSQ